MATRVDELRNGNAGPPGAYANLNDRLLVLDFQAGNGNRDPAFAEIHRRYSGLARHVCFKILANPSDAEDATQEAMVRVFQGLGRFNGRYRLQPWVARIATNVSLDILRARARRPQTADSELAELDGVCDDSEEPSILVERLLEQERIGKILAELPDHHREALVLREYEGRSHEEIGKALGVTPLQAKALIHRAKGSFRRAWNLKEERSRGLAVLGPLFLAPFRASEWLRRLFGSATEAAATTTASPVAATTAISVGERVTAAAVVVVMAATVGVGAVTLRHRAADGKADQQQAAVVAPSPAPPAVAPAVRPERTQPNRVHKLGHPQRAKANDPTPVVEVAPAVSPTAPPTPSPTVSETPPPSVSPVPVPPPSWSGAFSSSILGKNIALTQIDSRVEGTVGRNFLFSQATNGSYTDGDGTARALYIEYWGSVADVGGTASTWVFVETAEGRYRYDGSLSLTATTLGDDGTWTYVFTGTYSLADAPETDLAMPKGGAITLVLRFWSDETSLYEASLSLVDAS